MMERSSLLFFSIFVSIAISSRVYQDITMRNSSEQLNPSTIQSPDFAFMTSNFKHPGHNKSVGGYIKEWFKNRALTNKYRAEIVEGHYCAKDFYKRELTYYSSSFCYWFPEKPFTSQSKSFGLNWRGKAKSGDHSLCGDITASGKCMKCVGCHNNNNSREVRKSFSFEEIELPDCMKEEQIEKRCNLLFDEKVEIIKAENVRCEELLQRYKNTMDKELLTETAACQQTVNEYKNGRATHLVSCAPSFYELSCEKACIERQQGCGVIEGTPPSEPLRLGGAEVECAPPRPSWIFGEQAMSEQCERIEAHQRPQYALSILKSGWLWYKGLITGWEKRFFVLQSGDQVRSAVFSNFRKKAPEERDHRRGKDILLWDAVGIQKVDGPHYGFQDDVACFKLVHFYRDYRYCVPADDGPSKDELNAERPAWMKMIGKVRATSERAEWVRLISASMVHAGAIKEIPFKGVFRCCCKGERPEDCQLLSGVQLKKSKHLSQFGLPVCPSHLGYHSWEKLKFKRLPPACVNHA